MLKGNEKRDYAKRKCYQGLFACLDNSEKSYRLEVQGKQLAIASDQPT